VCFGDLQSCTEGVATNPEGQGESRQGKDQAGHGLSRVVDALILQGHGLVVLQAVTVHPLSQGEGADDSSRQNGTARHTSEAVGLPAAGELHLSGARDRVNGQAMDGAAVLTDAKHEVSVVDV